MLTHNMCQGHMLERDHYHSCAVDLLKSCLCCLFNVVVAVSKS